MNSRRGSISDYPEHLNPFYEGNEKSRFWKFGKVKRRGSFSESLRNTFTLKSFRGKKNDAHVPSSPPELRKNGPNTETRHRQTLPTTLSPIYSPVRSSVQVALPRSRFSERVVKLSTSPSDDEVPNGHIPTNPAKESSSTVNPFDENEKLPELKLKRIRRRKRRAPLPPNMTREEGDAAYLGVSSEHNLSKWSLTSVETDVSTYSENENLALDIVNQEISEIMNNITKEMEKMTDETHESGIQTKETVEERTYSDIPDLIASSTEGNKNTVDEVHVAEITENDFNENPIDENSNLVPKIKCDNIEDKLKDVDNCDNEVIHESENVSHELECDNNANSVCEDSHTEVVYNTTINQVSSEQDLQFNERKSIYITASNDQLNKSGSLNNIVNSAEVTENADSTQDNTTPPVSPRCKTEVTLILDTCHTSIENQKVSETENEKTTETTNINSPIPKTRAHKLSKGDLLGNNATVNA